MLAFRQIQGYLKTEHIYRSDQAVRVAIRIINHKRYSLLAHTPAEQRTDLTHAVTVCRSCAQALLRHLSLDAEALEGTIATLLYRVWYAQCPCQVWR